MVTGRAPGEPWLQERYSTDNLTWQAAAMRQRLHFRRTGVSLGVVTADRSGPHEPTPRPGNQICRGVAAYFLVLTARPEMGQELTGFEPRPRRVPPPQPLRLVPWLARLLRRPLAAAAEDPSPRPLICAALLGAQSEASDTVKNLSAQINGEHGAIPRHHDSAYTTIEVVGLLTTILVATVVNRPCIAQSHRATAQMPTHRRSGQ